MFRAFLADDEPMICNGLMNLIDWSDMNCEVCGSAADGREGLAQILRLRPDIVISDICMPEMDGLAMIGKIREALPDCKVILVTAYREFDYVQRAMQLGAFDFLLKPFKIQALADTVRRAAAELSSRLSREEEARRFRECYEKSLPALRERCLFDLLIYGSAGREGELLARECGLEMGDFVMAAFRFPSLPQGRGLESPRRAGIIKTLQELFAKGYRVEKASVSSALCVFLFEWKPDGAPVAGAAYDQGLYRDIERTVTRIRECFQVSLLVGVSNRGRGVGEISARYEECLYALEQIDAAGQPILLFGDLEHLYRNRGMSMLNELQGQIVDAVQLGKSQKAAELLAAASDCADPQLLESFFSTTYRKVRYIEDSLRKLVGSASAGPPLPDGPRERYEFLRDYLDCVSREVQGVNTCKTNTLVEEAVRYMEENYATPITLNCVAEQVHVSMYYLSRLFSRQFDQTFSDYLTGIRIRRAKEYLRDTDYRSYEIGERVGFADPNYFSKCFKKQVGLSPTAYREQARGGAADGTEKE